MTLLKNTEFYDFVLKFENIKILINNNDIKYNKMGYKDVLDELSKLIHALENYDCYCMEIDDIEIEVSYLSEFTKFEQFGGKGVRMKAKVPNKETLPVFRELYEAIKENEKNYSKDD